MLAFYLSLIETERGKTKFEILYGSHLNLIHRIAFDILQTDNDADDAVQESLIRLADNIKNIDDVESQETRAFICAVVRNVSLNILKKRERQKTADINLYDIPVAESKAFETMYSREVIELINKMPEDCKDVLLLKIKYGMSVKEISRTLGISQNAVYKRIAKARKILSEVLYEE